MARREALEASSLSAPITFTLPAACEEGVTCVYWDEEALAWSSRGVSVNSQSTFGMPIICDTWHLSLFGALYQGFLDALLCNQLSLFNVAAFLEVLYGDWRSSPGALFFRMLLALLSGIFAAAAYTDRKRQRHAWSPEFFLLPEGASVSSPVEASADPTEAPTEEEEPLDIHKGFIFFILVNLVGCLAACLAWFRGSALHDALDEIFSEWFSAFGELHALFESIWDDLEISAISVHHICRMVMSRVIQTSARRLTAATTGLTNDVVDFVLYDQKLRKVLMHRHNCSPEEPAGSAQEVNTARTVARSASCAGTTA